MLRQSHQSVPNTPKTATGSPGMSTRRREAGRSTTNTTNQFQLPSDFSRRFRSIAKQRQRWSMGKTRTASSPSHRPLLIQTLLLRPFVARIVLLRPAIAGARNNEGQPYSDCPLLMWLVPSLSGCNHRLFKTRRDQFLEVMNDSVHCGCHLGAQISSVAETLSGHRCNDRFRRLPVELLGCGQ